MPTCLGDHPATDHDECGVPQHLGVVVRVARLRTTSAGARRPRVSRNPRYERAVVVAEAMVGGDGSRPSLHHQGVELSLLRRIRPAVEAGGLLVSRPASLL